MSERYIPLSVRYGSRRKRLAWWFGTQRERLALRLAPWLDPERRSAGPSEPSTKSQADSQVEGETP